VKVPNADHEPTHNGCGAFGAEVGFCAFGRGLGNIPMGLAVNP